jgi:hypothetical protein
MAKSPQPTDFWKRPIESVVQMTDEEFEILVAAMRRDSGLQTSAASGVAVQLETLEDLGKIPADSRIAFIDDFITFRNAKIKARDLNADTYFDAEIAKFGSFKAMLAAVSRIPETHPTIASLTAIQLVDAERELRSLMKQTGAQIAEAKDMKWSDDGKIGASGKVKIADPSGAVLFEGDSTPGSRAQADPHPGEFRRERILGWPSALLDNSGVPK